MDVLIGYHRHLVEGWLLVMLLNLMLPRVLREADLKRVFYTRVGYFAFWALWAMVLFSGLMVWLFAGRPLTLSVDLMFGAGVLLPILDAWRAIRLRKIWLAEGTGIGFSSAVTGLEISIVLLVTLVAVKS